MGSGMRHSTPSAPYYGRLQILSLVLVLKILLLTLPTVRARWLMAKQAAIATDSQTSENTIFPGESETWSD